MDVEKSPPDFPSEHRIERVASVPDSDSTSALRATIDPAAEAKLLRKLDLHICPVLFLLYFLCFLDRSNIGNAKIQGMTEDLDLSGNRYNVVLMVFFVPYTLLEVPSNMIFKHARPSYYLAALVFCWGVANMCMGFLQTYGGLVGLRFLLGCFEAGLYPGIVYFTSMYYKRHELNRRMSAIFTANLLSSAFSGLLAFAIGHMSGLGGYKGWRWIFIIEGAATAALSLVAFFFIADWPEQARFLNDEERSLLRRRLELDGQRNADRLDRATVIGLFTDYKIWLISLLDIGTAAVGYAMSFFLPTILSEMGYTVAEAQVHTIPVYLVALVLMLTIAFASDRLRHRYTFIAAPLLVSAVGFTVLLLSAGQQQQQRLGVGARYVATFLAGCGGWSIPLTFTWLLNNTLGHWRRAIGSAAVNTIGNFGGIVASNVFLGKA